jgi:hypothetical protein
MLRDFPFPERYSVANLFLLPHLKNVYLIFFGVFKHESQEVYSQQHLIDIKLGTMFLLYYLALHEFVILKDSLFYYFIIYFDGELVAMLVIS